MVVVSPIYIFRDVHIDHEKFISPESAVSVNNTGFPFPDRLDLGSGKLNASREIL